MLASCVLWLLPALGYALQDGPTQEKSVEQEVYYSGYDLMLRLVNDVRKLNGRSKLCNSPKLMTSAQLHSNYQASIIRMTHDDPVPLFDRFTNVGFSAQGVAENVAMMSSFTVEGVMRLWIGSPGRSDER